MKIQLLAVVTAFLFSQSGLASGGVDIGNGGRALVGLLNGNYQTEDQVFQDSRQLADTINSQQLNRAHDWIRQGRCDQIMSFAGTNLYRSFEFDGSEMVNTYWGYTRVALENCQTPENISGDVLPDELQTDF